MYYMYTRYFLAALELFSFPLLAAGTAGLSEPPELNTVSILELQSVIRLAVYPPRS